MGLEARDVAPTWVQPIKNRRGFEVILDRLEAALLSGELSVGDRLPGERELAAGFGVSRTSVREALRVLEALGILEVKRGTEGVSLRNEPGDAFADLLRLHIALGHYDARSVVEFRTILEAWAAAKVAEEADEHLFSRLSEIVDRMADSSLDPLAFHGLDVQFHETLIEVSGNALVALALRSCRTVNRQAMLDGLASGEWPQTLKELHHEHRRLLDAIRAGDPALAATAIKDHIVRWSLRTVERPRSESPSRDSAGSRSGFTTQVV